ncbi:LysM peptidoglycan-binding domain-containing protein [Gammaproteobacteria bacterium]
MMSLKKFFSLIFFAVPLIAAPIGNAADLEINPRHPENYAVVAGDTLWEIAARFLVHPWHWQDLWHANPQIDNPNLIYPGDIISIRIVDGQAMAGITRGGAVIKLSPTIRKTALVEAIPTIPLNAIQPFLARVRVTAPGELEQAPYIVSQIDQRLTSTTGDYVYARGIISEKIAEKATHYDIYRAGRPYYGQAENGKASLLGIEAIPVGEAELKRCGDPASLLVTRSSSEILAGDRLLPAESDTFDRNFMPHAPDFPVEGRIIDVLGGLSRVSRFQTVVIDKGRYDNLDVGHVLAIHQAGNVIKDPVTQEYITLPEERSGLLMVFRVFDQLSYALVLEAQREMQLLDMVRPPQP